MNRDERNGAERMLREILLELKAERQFLPAYHVQQVGRRLLDQEPDGCVFPAAAAMPAIEDTPTVRALT